VIRGDGGGGARGRPQCHIRLHLRFIARDNERNQ